MRRYDVAVAALALDVDQKWIDNVLSHFSVAGVDQSVQGRSRHLDDHAVLSLAVLLRLSRELGIPLGRALPLVSSLVDHGSTTVGELQISVSIPSLRDVLAARLADAVEMAVAPLRGRPPMKKTRGTRARN